MECLSYCIGDRIDLTRLDNYCKEALVDYTSIKSRDVLKLIPTYAPKVVIFVFKNGTIVSWGVKRYQIKRYIDTIGQFANKTFSNPVHDEFVYRLSDKTAIEPHDFFDVDCLRLESGPDDASENDDLKLALSYGFSQSVKLQYFENILEVLIEKYTPLIQSLSKKGAMLINRHQLLQAIGEIVDAKSEMNLISNFLYHPKYFWQHPTLEEYYIMLERYLHIQRRVNAINHRLDALNEIFDMFSVYLENRHSHHLEVIIIVLITIEIITTVLNFHF